jgi:hypothetical protein
MSGFGIPLTLRGGEAGLLESWDGTFLVVKVPVPFAPGAPVGMLLGLPMPLPLEGKSIGSKVGADGQFTVRMRLITLPKSTRLALDALRDA